MDREVVQVGLFAGWVTVCGADDTTDGYLTTEQGPKRQSSKKFAGFQV